MIAIAWANSPWSSTHFGLWADPISIDGARFEFTLHGFINDGLMTVFFFLVGLEINREILIAREHHRIPEHHAGQCALDSRPPIPWRQ